jgi:hypothetical protein
MGDTKGGIMPKAHEGLPPDSPSDVRALPARPNLEFEHKQAKKLLKALHEGYPEALVRVRAKLKHSAETRPEEFQLSDAQFTIAREYGFTSWPRLVEYFEALQRQELSGPRERQHSPSQNEAWARTIVAEHRDKRSWTVQFLTAYVPRFYGRTVGEVFASEVTLDDAKLATARMHRYPSWEVMLAETKPYDSWAEHDSPLARASRAMRAGDLDTMTRLVEEHPALLSPSEGHPRSETLARQVVLFDIKSASPESRRVYEWLRERIDPTETLNWMQLGYMRMTKEEMQRLLDLGADPNWVPPNGYSVLEHVIWRCWNGDIVDLIASRVKPRQAFWIAAGLGDAGAIKSCIDESGVPTDAAWQNRPDFTALGYLPMPTNPAPDDHGLVWEAFLVAVFNRRFAVLDVLLDRGFPIDYQGWGSTALHLAVGNGWVEVVEYLVKRGADVNLKGWRPHLSPREAAEQRFLNPHGAPNAERILQLVGGRDPETLRRLRDERKQTRVLPTARNVETAFEHAKLDAKEHGLAAVGTEHMFNGLLRDSGLTVAAFAQAGLDLEKLRSQVRYSPDAVLVKLPDEMTANPELSAILLDARTLAEEKNHEILNSMHVMYALLRRAPATVLRIIESAGGTKEKVLASIEQLLA